MSDLFFRILYFKLPSTELILAVVRLAGFRRRGSASGRAANLIVFYKALKGEASLLSKNYRFQKSLPSKMLD